MPSTPGERQEMDRVNGRRDFLRSLAVAGSAVPALTSAGPAEARPLHVEPDSACRGESATALARSGAADRTYWLEVVRRLADPVLGALAARQLKARMPVESQGDVADRRRYSHLEALGRLLAGIAPWLESTGLSGAEETERQRIAALAREGLDAATDPRSPDAMNFTDGGQPLVDAAFLAHALLRAPAELWDRLTPAVQDRVIGALQSTRVIRPGFNNWLLFSATIEAALARFGRQWDRMRVDYAIRQHEQWYKGDGVYGDGPAFHWDYYNSFVIQPMLLDVLRVVATPGSGWESFNEPVLARARRYAEIQERLIAPDGSFPAIGRSIAYRFGAFQLLGQIALVRRLPDALTPPGVRCAITAAVRRSIEAPGTFDAQGWLRIGLCGHQPRLGERYISTGSLYLCAVGLLPLGLPPSDDFWAAPAAKWTSQRIWSGEDLEADHAI
jgi:hypothetical protein